MKKNSVILLIVILVLFSEYSFSQNVAINNTGNPPNSHAILDIDVSTNDMGILIPRLTSAERTAMSLAAADEGLTVYDETTKTYWLWDGTAWANFASAGSGWLLTGNIGTTNGTDFLGTTDNVALDIRTNNIIRARFTTNGQLEFLNNGKSVFLGEGAGANDDLNDNDNIAIGYNALNANASGTFNIAIGYTAMEHATSDGMYNIAIGPFALQNNQGDNNVAVGDGSMNRNTTGTDNTAVGAGSLFYNTTGNNNAAFGKHALLNNTTGYNNIAIGSGAILRMDDNYSNIVIGTEGMRENNGSSANENTAIGDSTGYESRNSGRNSYLGYKTGKNFKYGQSNVAIGWEALYAFNGVDGSGKDIPVNGWYDGNVAIGQQAMYYTPGNNNVAVGLTALFANGGTDNVALGHDAQGGSTVETDNITAIGAYSDCRNDNATAIGYRAQALAPNTMVLGSINGVNGATADVNVGIRTQYPSAPLEVNGEIKTSNGVNGYLTLGSCDNSSEGGQINYTGAGSYPTWYEDVAANDHRLFVSTDVTPIFKIMNIGAGAVNLQIDGQAFKPGGGSWAVGSDIRSKENIVNYDKGLNELMQLRPVTFNYKKEFNWGDKTYTGLIAQEVEKVVPTMVSIHPTNGIDDFRVIDPNELTYMLINSVKEQQQTIEQLQNTIEEMQEEIDNLKN